MSEDHKTGRTDASSAQVCHLGTIIMPKWQSTSCNNASSPYAKPVHQGWGGYRQLGMTRVVYRDSLYTTLG